MPPLRGLGLGGYAVSIDISSLRDWPIGAAEFIFVELRLCEKLSEKPEIL